MPIAADWDAQRRMWTLDVGERFTLDEITGLIEKTEWRHTGASVLFALWAHSRFRASSRGPKRFVPACVEKAVDS